MKKSILTIGLFSLVMILTSFTTPETAAKLNNNTSIGLTGNQSVGQDRKVDLTGNQSVGQDRKVDLTGNQSVGQDRKVD